MQTGKLSNNEARDFTDFIRLSYKDLKTTGFLSTIGAANQRIIGYVPAGGAVTQCAVIQITDPAGASDLTLDVGTTDSDPDEYLDAIDIDGMTKCGYNNGESFVGEAGTTDPGNVVNAVVNNTAAAIPIYMEFNGTHSSLTAGEWVIAWHILDPGRFGVSPVS